ncbi:SHOCT domain-containing protein [Desulfoferula mesophila]|uniref:SHOCT domain-containing protein n=1 Tax=Desulfoferula mesophila TaxID=3058419 RepID=A0AAU9EW54_9BACT|nr:hypothetical protein FAK_10290 [Desulfoferula mesophilus]
MKTLYTMIFVAMFGLSIALAGCGGADVQTQNTTTTVSEGQQLIDLQKAYEAGAITKEQYEQQKAKVLNRK